MAGILGWCLEEEARWDAYLPSDISVINHVSQATHRCNEVYFNFVTFRVSRRRREMYCGHARLSVCLFVCPSAAACPHYCTDPDVTWQSGRGCP